VENQDIRLPWHKAIDCKVEQKVNELFVDKPYLKAKVMAIVANDQTDSDQDFY